MGHFSYKAVETSGLNVTGTIEAADRRSAVAALSEKGQFVINLTEETRTQSAGEDKKTAPSLADFIPFRGRRISSKDVMAITSQLSTALRAGLPLLNALEIIRDQQHKHACLLYTSPSPRD